MTTATIDAEKLYEKEIARLQGEIGTLEDDKKKLEHRNAGLNKENTDLEKIIQLNRDKIVDLEEKQKKAEEDFKNSRANSIKALEKQDKDSAERAEKADKACAAAKTETDKANAARNQLISIATDIKETVEKIETGIKSKTDSVKTELQGYLALGDPKAEIPSKETKKK